MEKKANKLIDEKSPYLLQHAYNPVDWHPWGEEAFERAKRENKPVFLSIGYSTCHWCHVMERESFEDSEVAEILNQHFISVKVDREERPDVDNIYMTVCQMLTGQGGWPLTIIMTPDKKPFLAGTYYPKNSKWGRPGIMDVLNTINKNWLNNETRDKLVSVSNHITEGLYCMQRPAKEVKLTEEILTEAYKQFEKSYDTRHGGFSAAPKFPTPHNMMFLLRYWHKTGEHKALSMVENTLKAMRQGGIYDHLGYGFARYSTDDKWLVPHFEKMLYDNALLCITYLEAYQCTGNEDFARVAEEILAYVARDMTDKTGGFYSAEDADSEGIEGKFYVFTRKEIIEVLGESDGDIFAEFYGASEQGNFEDGTNILNFIGENLQEYCSRVNLSEDEVRKILEKGRKQLFTYRKNRIHPHKDDKILTAWNALMIVAFAKASRILNRSDYTIMAQRAIDFIYSKLIREDGRLLARYRDGDAAYAAYLDDYAFLLWALVETYETVYEPIYLHRAMELYSDLKTLFWDEANGGFFFYGLDSEELLIRPKELYDGAMPSGNSVAALALLQLARLTENKEVLELANNQIEAFSYEAQRHPKAFTFFLIAFSYYLSVPQHIVVAGSSDSEDTWSMLNEVGNKFLPYTVIMLNDSEHKELINEVLPHIVEQQPLEGKATAYVCNNLSCKPPISSIERLGEQIKQLQ
ncbi:thioredoxin domain-containing protein [Dendrosporobacter sp. 1207_IL3150]|uniref:thioredoxin domain-containing protein n=1 Tax=Dendrosporobacter sp. 1207_IL3150 TaxID=3084054 RepID=UPI002FD8E039